jgi:transposase
MVNVAIEKPVKLKTVAQQFEVGLRTVYQWANRQRGNRLETFKAGGKRYTSWAAVQRFTGQPVEQQSQQSEAYHAAMDQLRNLNEVA